MGLVASQGRILMLTSRKSDLEFDLQQINQMRMMLAQIQGFMFMQQGGLVMGQLQGGPLGQDLSPEKARAQYIQQRLAALQQMDKAYEIQAKQIETQHKTVTTELDAVQKVVDKNIEKTFSITGFA